MLNVEQVAENWKAIVLLPTGVLSDELVDSIAINYNRIGEDAKANCMTPNE